MKYQSAAELFKALSDENRLAILYLLNDGEKCACKLLEGLQITQSTLSHHMKILCDAGLVQGRREGKWVHYRIEHSSVVQIKAVLGELSGSSEKEE